MLLLSNHLLTSLSTALAAGQMDTHTYTASCSLWWHNKK